MSIDERGRIYFLSKFTYLAWSNETEHNADSSFVGHRPFLVRGWCKWRFGKLFKFCCKQFITIHLAYALTQITKSIEQGAAGEITGVSVSR